MRPHSRDDTINSPAPMSSTAEDQIQEKLAEISISNKDDTAIKDQQTPVNVS